MYQLQSIPHAGTGLGLLLGGGLGPLLQLLHRVGVAGLAVGPVCLDGLLAVRGQLGLPVALALLLLGQRIDLVLLVVGIVCEGRLVSCWS